MDGTTFLLPKVRSRSFTLKSLSVRSLTFIGGTGLEHMVTMSRSKNIRGPYEPNPANPVLTNANTTEYCKFPALASLSILFSHATVQTVGHADLFQDGFGNWLDQLTLDGCEISILTNSRWGVALSTRSGPSYLNYPMGRETIMVPVAWDQGEFPTWSPAKGQMSGWAFPPENKDIQGSG